MSYPNGFIPAGKSTVMLRVTSYEDRNLTGTVSGPLLEGPVRFSSLTELLLLLEALMDRSNLPQRGAECRGFREPQVDFTPATGEEKPIDAFELSVMFRQNASWQGSLLWHRRGMEAQFRSVLELIRLLDTALTAKEE